MRIMNAIASGGELFDKEGYLKFPMWPQDGHKLCPHQSDRNLMKYLEDAEWSQGMVCASARWWEHTEDELYRGAEFTKGTFGFRGSGIHFYYCYVTMLTRWNCHFLCEVPWGDIFYKENDFFIFVGGDNMRKAFLNRAAKALEEHEERSLQLQKEVEEEGVTIERLRFAMEE